MTATFIIDSPEAPRVETASFPETHDAGSARGAAPLFAVPPHATPQRATPEVVERLEAAEIVGEDLPQEEVLVFTIHDGCQIPRFLFGDHSGEVLARPDVARAYVKERDWGANLVARALAEEIGLGGYLRINLARVVMDYGRFPGTSDTTAPYLERRAIYPPLHAILPEATKHELLARYYDTTSDFLTGRIKNKRVTLAIHTYDRLNRSGTERPEISLVSRLLEYQINSTVPPDVFDPLFPPILSESTCHRSLSYRALVDLQDDGFSTSINYPYVMPVGSLEIRAQVWFFFDHLKRHFEAEHKASATMPAYDLVWCMLHDVIRRSWEGELLRGYLHQYREAPLHERPLFEEARHAYETIRNFLDAHRRELVDDYRNSLARPSSLGVEVRKDLLCDVDLERGRVRLRDDAEQVARDIARHLAKAVRHYLELGEDPAARRREPVVA